MMHSKCWCRIALGGTLAVMAVAGPVRADAKEDAAVLALQQSAIAAGRRTVTVVAEGRATRTADKMAAELVLNSGNGPAGEMEQRLGEIEGRVATALAEAGLRLPAEKDEGRPTSTGSNQQGPTAYFERTYTIPVASLDAYRTVANAVRRLAEETNTIGPEPRLTRVTFRADSSKLEADREVVQLEARQNALADAKAKATENAKALGMKLGPPLLVGAIETKMYGNGGTIEQGYVASGVVLFELVE